MKDNYRVRPAQLADADGLCRILESLGWFPHLDGSSQSRAGIIRQIALCLADYGHCLLVAQQPGAGLVGYVSLHRNPSLFLASPEGLPGRAVRAPGGQKARSGHRPVGRSGALGPAGGLLTHDADQQPPAPILPG